MWRLHHLATTALGLVLAAAQTKLSPEVTTAEILQAINEISDCESLDQIHIDHLEYFDFKGEGRKQAVVVASTCMTGTAGPDIHSVFEREAGGKIAEVPFRHIEEDTVLKSKIPVFGNPNYGLAVEDGQLVARWLDSSDRLAPLVVWYKWSGKEFVVDRLKAEGPFLTSYDCGNAIREMDRAICYSPSVAALDVQMGKAYQARIRQLPPRQKRSFQEQQREWLAMREKKCAIYKWWVECLADLYKVRIEKLTRP